MLCRSILEENDILELVTRYRHFHFLGESAIGKVSKVATVLHLQQVDLLEKPYLVTEHRARKYLDPRTGRIVIAPLPVDVKAAGLVGPKLSALAAYQKGDCLLTKAHDPFIDQWEIDLTTKKSRELNAHKVDKKKLQKIESEVSAYMNDNFSFAIMRFEKRSERFHVERSLLSTVSQCSGCGPTEHWLGKYHPNSVIRESGLWNIQGLDSLPSTLDEVCQIVQAGTIEGI